MMLQSTAHATPLKFARASRDLSDDRQTIFSCMSQSPTVGTPQILWAATPTPGAGGSRECYSFALPEPSCFPRHGSASDLSANAAVFVPQEAVEEPCGIGAVARVLGRGTSIEPQGEQEFLLDSAEAQAVTMAESVLTSLDHQGPSPELDRQEVVRPLPCLLKQHVSSAPSQAWSSSAGTTPLLTSRGSAEHPKDCKPCAWMWKPKGCQTGSFCEYCHLCPKDELKRRKKAKVNAMRIGGLMEPCTTTYTSSTSVPLRSLKLFDLL